MEQRFQYDFLKHFAILVKIQVKNWLLGNPSIQEAVEGGSQVQVQPSIYTVYIYIKKTKQNLVCWYLESRDGKDCSSILAKKVCVNTAMQEA